MSMRPRDEQPLAGFGPTRVFRGASMREAFSSVKTTMGIDAVILTTRDLGRDVADHERFEVVAAWPSATTQANEPHPAARAPHTQRHLHEGPRGPDEARLSSQIVQLEQAVRGLEGQLQQLADKDRRLREELKRASQVKVVDDDDGPIATLIAAGIEHDVAAKLVERAMRRVTPRHGIAVARQPDLEAEILQTIVPAKPLWSAPAGSIAALIGPSAAGKTTTLLKIAGLAKFAHRRDVAIISVDLERLGTFESLCMYADVMGVPVLAARDRAEVEAALEHFADRELVFIDTPGHNPFDPEQRFAALKPVSGREVRHHLVLPATLSPALVADTLAAYDGPALTSLLVTRLDEARGPSAVLAACMSGDLPVSHLAAGRAIPDDIRAVEVREVVRMLFGKAS